MSDLCMQLSVGADSHPRPVLTVTHDTYDSKLTADTERRIIRYTGLHKTFPWHDAEAVDMLLDALNTMAITITETHMKAKETNQ